ncbi:oxidoreductase [Luteibacter aegosomatissinici]|uniref:oxidoreductase n=1 Tax=Luteibacter aegosomatissinici TaxID=2911539 RepID=UPI001FFAA3E5|nr:oxidoreductase [Luteibacter aegosomatissinici]UPG94553.1 oxidoreductase [Luteibacter aegosomatissinici]
MTAPNNQKVFLITGVSSGFGRCFAEVALADGHTVIGTVRTEHDKSDFESLVPGRSVAVQLELSQLDSIARAIDGVVEVTGPIDVLVNNAGYGYEGPLEESSLEDLHHQFTVNVFAAVAMMKAVLPSMRERRRGRIVNITSLAGYVAAAGIAYYAGSKFALEAISEALAQEVSDFGVHVTALAPGAFRTQWAGRSLVRNTRSIPDYDGVFEPVRRARMAKDGNQPGNPYEAARVLMDIVDSDNPPRHLVLGSDAVETVRKQLGETTRQLDIWDPVSRSTDYN